MNLKITKTEFQKWSQQLETIYRELLRSSSGLSFADKTEEEIFIKMGVATSFYTGRGLIQATLAAMLFLETVGLKNNVPFSALDGLTFQQWEEKVFARMKEHCIANGYYNPNSPPDLVLLKERREKVRKILLEDSNQLYQLLAYADRENYETIVNTKVFLEELKKTIPDNTRDNNDIPRGIDFFIEDLVGRVEKLIKQKEEAEKTNKPTDNSPDSSFSPQYQSNLVAEIKQLQDQVNDLENKVNKTTDPTEKNTYQDMLDNAKKNLGDKEKEKERWKKKTPVSPNKNDNKLNLAVGLGMVAVIIGLICLILLASRRKER